MSSPDLQKLREILGADVPDELLQLALTHPSSVGEGLERTLKSNQRLEFLGDAIVGATVAEHWFRTQSNLPEGELTQRKAAAVQKKSLASVAAPASSVDTTRASRSPSASRSIGSAPRNAPVVARIGAPSIASSRVPSASTMPSTATKAGRAGGGSGVATTAVPASARNGTACELPQSSQPANSVSAPSASGSAPSVRRVSKNERRARA